MSELTRNLFINGKSVEQNSKETYHGTANATDNALDIFVQADQVCPDSERDSYNKLRSDLMSFRARCRKIGEGIERYEDEHGAERALEIAIEEAPDA